MKKIIIILISVFIVSCSDFLDTDQLTQKVKRFSKNISAISI